MHPKMSSLFITKPEAYLTAMSSVGPAEKIQADDVAAVFREQIQKVVAQLKEV